VTPSTGYLSLRQLAQYSGLCIRTLRAKLVQPVRPLPHYKVGGKILVRRDEFDSWMGAHRATADETQIDRLVDEVLRGV
jgi:hypothetical protein